MSQEQQCRRAAEVRQRIQEQKLRKLFNADQLKALASRTTRGRPWETATIKKALKLRFSCGATGYEEILKSGIPLPAVRTLQQKLRHIVFRAGLIEPVFNYLQMKVFHSAVILSTFHSHRTVGCICTSSTHRAQRLHFLSSTISVP